MTTRLADEVRTIRAALTRAATEVGAEACADSPSSDHRGAPEDPLALLAELERLKATASALQARLAVRLDASRRAHEARDGVPLARRGRGVALELALARAQSHHRGRVLLGAAKALVREMPFTFGALANGELTEDQAVLLVRETACLSREARATVDATLCRTAPRSRGLGTRALVAEARRLGARLEPASLVRRTRRAESERCVTVRPAPDAMVYLTALLPVAAGVQAYATLRHAADTARASGAAGTRSSGQVMADLLVERLTGRADARAVPVTVNLVMSDAALLGSDAEPGHVAGYGPVPAQVARTMVARGIDAGAAWLRRLYADPGGDLVAAASRARFHPQGLSALLRARDQGTCRMPYCDAPVRHVDHVVPAADGGSTSARNAQGLCEACNLAKEAAGLRSRVEPGTARHTVVTTTADGTFHRSVAPAAPAPLRWPERRADTWSGTDLSTGQAEGDLVARSHQEPAPRNDDRRRASRARRRPGPRPEQGAPRENGFRRLARPEAEGPLPEAPRRRVTGRRRAAPGRSVVAPRAAGRPRAAASRGPMPRPGSPQPAGSIEQAGPEGSRAVRTAQARPA